MVSAPSLTIHHYIPVPALIGDGIFLVFILEDGHIDFHVAFGLPVALFMVLMPGAPRSIRS